jgi:D-alanyl-lipoteichoic acid acyltransferase DltB (MBOAT superfamily)
MLFPTFDYFLFLPLVALVHWVLRANGLRTAWLLVVSLVFYASWNPIDTLLLLGIVGLAYVSGRVISGLSEARRRPALLAAALVMLSPLLFYKYAGFFLENLRMVWPDAPPPPTTHFPIGISFYSFQALAYVIDVRRGQAPEKDPIRFCTFLLFFPHLVAGPILRASALLTQLAAPRTLLPSDVGEGLARIGVGLVKKVLVADVLRLGMVDSVFTDPGSFTGLEVMVALYAFTLQIYCDFSGYTDFAVGSARLFGFKMPENFDRPYQALSVASYWRRWHMTLSDWVRDYVYYPLGGSRGGGFAPYRNTFITLLILGFWHGANWTFVVYGLLHGAAVGLNRWWRTDGPGKTLPAPGPFGIAWRWMLTFHFVVLARILFRADDLTQSWALVKALGNTVLAMPRFSYHAWAVLLLGYAVHFTPTSWARLARERFATLPAPAWGLALAAAGWACVRWRVGDNLAFIYYDF